METDVRKGAVKQADREGTERRLRGANPSRHVLFFPARSLGALSSAVILGQPTWPFRGS
jgi:hypothetical protein